MASMQGFVIALVLTGLSITGFMLFISDGAVEYGITFDNSSLQPYDQLTELNDQAEDLKNKVTSIQPQSSALDVIGAYLTSAYSAAITFELSLDTFITLSDTSFNNMQLDYKWLSLIKTSLMAIVIFGIAAIFLSYFLKVRV